MKNKLIKAIAGIGFLVLMTITFTMSSNQMNQNSDVTLENIAALNTAEAEGGTYRCWGLYGLCTIASDGEFVYGYKIRY